MPKASLGVSRSPVRVLTASVSCTALKTIGTDAGLRFTPLPKRLSYTHSEYVPLSTNALTLDHAMNNFSFEIVLADATEVTEELADRIFIAGGDDATPTSRNGVVTIGFDRQANSIEDAVRSALKTIHDAGYVARTVQAAPESFAI